MTSLTAFLFKPRLNFVDVLVLAGCVELSNFVGPFWPLLIVIPASIASGAIERRFWTEGNLK